jgi:hypothetical protein
MYHINTTFSLINLKPTFLLDLEKFIMHCRYNGECRYFDYSTIAIIGGGDSVATVEQVGLADRLVFLNLELLLSGMYLVRAKLSMV